MMGTIHELRNEREAFKSMDDTMEAIPVNDGLGLLAPGAIERHKAKPSIWWQRLGAALLIASAAVLVLWAAWHWRDVPARAGEYVAELFGRMR